MTDLRWQNWMVFMFGIHIIATPWTLSYLFGYSLYTWAFAAQVAVGCLITFVAYLGLLYAEAWHEAIKITGGMWILISPWVLGFSSLSAFAYNNIVCGAALMLFGGLALIAGHPGTGSRSF